MTNNATRAASRSTQISIGNAVYQLTFGVYALARLQDHWELDNVTAVGERVAAMKDGNAKDLVAIFWASLARHHPDVSLEEAWKLADDAGFAMLAQSLSKAVVASMPPAEKGGGKSAAPGKRGR